MIGPGTRLLYEPLFICPWGTLHSIPEKTVARVMHEDDDLRIVYAGKIDARINTSSAEGIPLDYKTESRRAFPDKKANQFLGYCWLTDSNEIAIQKIGMQGAPWTNKEGLIKKSSSRANHFYLLNYTDELIEDWLENTIYTAKMWITHMETGFYPQHRTSCMEYSRPCAYWRVCEDRREHEEEVLATYYQDSKPWDILNPGRD